MYFPKSYHSNLIIRTAVKYPNITTPPHQFRAASRRSASHSNKYRKWTRRARPQCHRKNAPSTRQIQPHASDLTQTLDTLFHGFELRVTGQATTLRLHRLRHLTCRLDATESPRVTQAYHWYSRPFQHLALFQMPSAATQYSRQTPFDREPSMPQSDEEAFENAIKSLEATAASVGMHLKIDSTARRIYAREIKAMSDNLRREVARGTLTWAQAAE